MWVKKTEEGFHWVLKDSVKPLRLEVWNSRPWARLWEEFIFRAVELDARRRIGKLEVTTMSITNNTSCFNQKSGLWEADQPIIVVEFSLHHLRERLINTSTYQCHSWPTSHASNSYTESAAPTSPANLFCSREKKFSSLSYISFLLNWSQVAFHSQVHPGSTLTGQERGTAWVDEPSPKWSYNEREQPMQWNITNSFA